MGCIIFQDTPCPHPDTIYVFTIRRGQWRSWQCMRCLSGWPSPAGGGYSGRRAQSQCTGWAIKLSTRRWPSRRPAAAMAMSKLDDTAPPVSLPSVFDLSAGPVLWKIKRTSKVYQCKCVLIVFDCFNEALNRSGELCARPGSCPATDGLYPGSKECQWDLDCSGWQKCCQGVNGSLCSEPTRECARKRNVGIELLFVGCHLFQAAMTTTARKTLTHNRT